VYSVQTDKYSSAAPTDSSTVNYCYYPVISINNPFNKQVEELMAKFHGHVPAESVPQVTKCAVLIKTKQFKTKGAIPGGIADEDSLQGLVITSIESLGSEEKKLLKEGMSGIDLDKVVIIEDGRKPSSAMLSVGMMAGGVLLIGGGIGTWLVK